MRKLLKPWYVWLGLVLLQGLVGSVALICSSRSLTQERFDRIQMGMTFEEVVAILDEPIPFGFGSLGRTSWTWEQCQDRITVDFEDRDNAACYKELHLATAWEKLRWYAKKGAEKIGVKWN